MSSVFSESNLIKKLEHVTNTQEGIQTLSLWMLHHKNYYKQIVAQWLKCYVKAKSSHKLALFYLANDIVQHAKRKSLVHYLSEFKGALLEAARVTNDDKIIPNINRVFTIWNDRSIFTDAFIDELRTTLSSKSVENASELISKITPDYSFADILYQINIVNKAEQNTKNKSQSLANCKIDFSNSELFNKLKDKSDGAQYNTEFDEATKCLNNVIEAHEKEAAARKELLLRLEKTKKYYDHEFRVAKNIAEKSDQSATQLKQVKSKLQGSSPRKASSSTAAASDSISTSELTSVINFFKQAQQNASATSSLDQRLTSLMSNSGQFNLAIDGGNPLLNKSYDPGYQPVYNASKSSDLYDHYYLPQEHNLSNNKGNQIDSVIGARIGLEHSENLEPADMDLGNSDDEESMKGTPMDEKLKHKPIDTMPFLAQDITGLGLLDFPPPPPLPPVPPKLPPALKEFIASGIDDKFGSFHGAHMPLVPSIVVDPNNAFSQVGNSIRNVADQRQYRNSSMPYNTPNSNNNINNNWRNTPDGRQPNRNQSFSNGNNRWKGNNGNNSNNRGWKRNSYGNHH